jgi:hypothetical protein
VTSIRKCHQVFFVVTVLFPEKPRKMLFEFRKWTSSKCYVKRRGNMPWCGCGVFFKLKTPYFLMNLVGFVVD